MDREDIYIDFASKISFLEFIQEEFRYSDLNLNKLRDEIELIKKTSKWNIDLLADSIMRYPALFLIFQEIFQLIRFTNTQLIHFIFNISILNSTNLNSIFEYMLYNVKFDEEFRKIFLSILGEKDYRQFIKNLKNYRKEFLIANFKMSISRYIKKISRDFKILEERVTKEEFKDFSIRFANYLLNNLKLSETLSSINVENFLKYKKIPLDTKSIHGNFMKIRIQETLDENDFINIDSLLQEKNITVISHKMKDILNNVSTNRDRLYCTEKFVEGIFIPKKGKLKKFDLIIFKNYTPKFLFEMNFYSTEGTKIGINITEYIDLKNFIDKNFKNKFKFYWITDGNYWLTKTGKNTFLNLLNYFDIIFNINIFKQNIKKFT